MQLSRRVWTKFGRLRLPRIRGFGVAPRTSSLLTAPSRRQGRIAIRLIYIFPQVDAITGFPLRTRKLKNWPTRAHYRMSGPLLSHPDKD